MIAAAAPNSLNQLRVQSEGYDLCVIDLGDLAAVSYTHLDVYKRQAVVRYSQFTSGCWMPHSA